ncbi:Metallo-dependent hydrolase [Parathielavia hyrcaniae]|uniref:Metallo-dependent hydrolase n=1 Tax=Parathielavia hyrcaniae TaxID=113614 RepID=A0AAN6Q604_9PEZI|nr:Metallo-dependent hydrolase [Parathielavia hyrcaniae]
MAPITDDEWADLVTHELPKASDPVIQRYLESRRALMAEEQKHRSDFSFRQALSPIAKKACEIVSKIRDDERKPGASPPPARQPATLKSWSIVRRMPKGALLRAHCCSLADIDHLVETALRTPGLCISCPSGHLATAAAREEAGLCIRYRGGADPDLGDRPPWTPDYKPGTFVPLTQAADSYPQGGKEGFVGWLKERCGGMSGPSSSGSDLMGGMLFYEPIWRAFFQRLMANLVEDGLAWLELRLTFPLVYYREGSEEPEPDYDHMFQAVEEEVATFRAGGPGFGRFWGLRVIWSTSMRNRDSRAIIESADDCIAAKLVWPQLVAGYDLADSERLGGRPLADLLPELFWFRKQCAVENVQIPFLLRTGGGSSGDRARDATGEDDVVDALLLGARRIGHATSLHRHPRLVEAVRDRRILVEGCPVFYNDTRLDPAADVAMHDGLRVLLAQGVPCALCDDDSGILPPPGKEREAGSRMTDLFWQVLDAWDEADLATLGSLAENSVRWAALEDQDPETWAQDIRAASVGAGVKAARLQQWAVDWERFCLWVVTEYGGDDGEDANVAG